MRKCGQQGGRGDIRRVASACAALPFAANLEQAVVPTATKVTAVVHEVLDRA
jgi:pyruvate/2-oxoglutarate/acetoin dehydrogenase E1 component